MTVHLTTDQARRLGLDVAPAKVRTTRRTVRGVPFKAWCWTCGERFTTEASMSRHVAGNFPTHTRYELLDERTPDA